MKPVSFVPVSLANLHAPRIAFWIKGGDRIGFYTSKEPFTKRLLPGQLLKVNRAYYILNETFQPNQNMVIVRPGITGSLTARFHNFDMNNTNRITLVDLDGNTLVYPVTLKVETQLAYKWVLFQMYKKGQLLLCHFNKHSLITKIDAREDY